MRRWWLILGGLALVAVATLLAWPRTVEPLVEQPTDTTPEFTDRKSVV